MKTEKVSAERAVCDPGCHHFEARYDMVDWKSDAAKAVYVGDICTRCGMTVDRSEERTHTKKDVAISVLPFEFCGV